AEADKERELRRGYRDCWAAARADPDDTAAGPYTQPAGGPKK
ncbi:hypothetical protein Tco_1348711, partial [Tanacetum coccineum]